MDVFRPVEPRRYRNLNQCPTSYHRGAMGVLEHVLCLAKRRHPGTCFFTHADGRSRCRARFKHVDSGRVVARAKIGSFGRTGELVVFSCTSAGLMRELVRWTPLAGSSPAVSRIHFIADHIVTARVGDVIHAWDLSQRKGIWRLPVSTWHQSFAR